MKEERSEIKAATPLHPDDLHPDELVAYGLNSFIGYPSTGQLRAVYGGSIKHVLRSRQSAAAAISAATAWLLRAAGQQSAMSAGIHLRTYGTAISAAVSVSERR